MEQELINEFSSLRDEVFEALRRGTYSKSHGVARVLRYLMLPSFHNPVSWDVVRSSSNSNNGVFSLVRTCWRMDLDGWEFESPIRRLRHPRPFKPTIEVDCVPLEAVQIETKIASFQTIHAPFFPTSIGMCLDGTLFELTIGNSYCNTRVAWCCTMPAEWRKMSNFINEMAQLFEDAWASRDQ